MSTIQSNNKSNSFFLRETNHNLMSLCFFSLLSLLVMIIFFTSIIYGLYPASIYTFVILLFSIIKCISQIKIIANFKSLTAKIEDRNLSHYITKSWIRKRNSTIWIGFSALFFTLYMLILSASFAVVYKTNAIFIANMVVVISGIFIILLTMYSNMQIIDNSLKYSKRKLPLHSIEWEQINKEFSVVYKTIFIWVIHFLCLLPILLLIIPQYRRKIKKIIQK